MSAPTTERTIGPMGTFAVAVAIGICSGLGAVMFRGLIGIFHNLFFAGVFSLKYDASAHTPPAPWGAAIIFVPVLVSLAVTFLVTRYAPEAKGHGVPEVIDAVYYKKGIIRPSLTWVKAIASALSIGSGGSVGREGPIIQIGSAFGSWLGQIMPVRPWERITWLACGAGAGIAATFNTPIGGILFATEIILQEVSVKTLVPVALSTAVASFVGRAFFGANPAFVIPAHAVTGISQGGATTLLAYVILGLLLGIVSEVFIQSIYKSEDVFESLIPHSPYLRHALGMLCVGALFYATLRLTGHYAIEGVGYSTIQDVLSHSLSFLHPALMVIPFLFFAKLAATSLTLGSGASGGIFSPALFLGATFGEVYELLFRHFFPSVALAPGSFAIVGMAGLVAGSTGAAVTAIVMVFEMTLDYSVVVPMTITVALSYGVRTMISSQSIYSLKLERRGHSIPASLQANLSLIRRVSEVADPHFAVLSAEMKISQLKEQIEAFGSTRFFIISEGEQPVGVLTFETAAKAGSDLSDVPLRSLANPDYLVVPESSSLASVMASLRHQNSEFILVAHDVLKVSTKEIKGFLPKEKLIDALLRENGFFSTDAA